MVGALGRSGRRLEEEILVFLGHVFQLLKTNLVGLHSIVSVSFVEVDLLWIHEKNFLVIRIFEIFKLRNVLLSLLLVVLVLTVLHV